MSSNHPWWKRAQDSFRLLTLHLWTWIGLVTVFLGPVLTKPLAPIVIQRGKCWLPHLVLHSSGPIKKIHSHDCGKCIYFPAHQVAVLSSRSFGLLQKTILRDQEQTLFLQSWKQNSTCWILYVSTARCGTPIFEHSNCTKKKLSVTLGFKPKVFAWKWYGTDSTPNIRAASWSEAKLGLNWPGKSRSANGSFLRARL